MIPPQYAIYGAQPHVYRPKNSQWKEPTHQNIRPSFQKFRAPYNIRPRQRSEGGQSTRNNFTHIGESYTIFFDMLKHLKMIEKIPQNYVNPNAEGFSPTIRCAYYSDAPGHST